MIYVGREYITSKEWHEQVKPTSGVSETNRAIRNMETYQELVNKNHIVEVTKDTADKEGDAELASLVVSNSYRPVMLIDAVAQKAIEHHFKQTASNALQSSKESAFLGLAGIRLDLIAKDPQIMMTLQLMSKQAELEERQTQLEKSVPTLIDEAAQKMAGHAGYMTVLAYARTRQIRLSATHAAVVGKAATKACNELGYKISSVSDARFGKVNAYPEEVLEAVFNENEGQA